MIVWPLLAIMLTALLAYLGWKVYKNYKINEKMEKWEDLVQNTKSKWVHGWGRVSSRARSGRLSLVQTEANTTEALALEANTTSVPVSMVRREIVAQ